jgi:hypothetical protein
MNLKVIGVEGVGDLEKERVVLQASENTDIGKFALFAANRSNEDQPFSGDIPDTYWFPFKEVKSGDFVVVYTKKGVRGEKTSDSGRTSYFYYWGYDKSKWGSNRIAVLVNTATWTTFKG